MNCQFRRAALDQITPVSTGIAQAGKYPQGSSCTTLPSEHGQLELRAVSSGGLSSSKDGYNTISMCSFFLGLATFTVKKFHLKWDFLYFYLFSMPLVLPLGTKEKSLALTLLCPSQTDPSMSWHWVCSSPGTGGLCTSLCRTS